MLVFFGRCVVSPSSTYDFWLHPWYLQTFGYCTVSPSSIYSFWLPFWYLQTFGHSVGCPSIYDLWSLFYYNQTLSHYICPSIYGFWLPFWYRQTFGQYIVFPFSTSDYFFGIFEHLAIKLSVLLRFTVSDYTFDIFKHLAILLSVLRFTFLITPLVFSNIWPLCCLSLYLRLMIIFLVSSNIWPLHFLFFDLWLLITPLITSNFSCILCLSTIIYITPLLKACILYQRNQIISIYRGNLREIFIYGILILSIFKIKNVVYLFFPIKISNGSKNINDSKYHFTRFKLVWMQSTKVCGVLILYN